MAEEKAITEKLLAIAHMGDSFSGEETKRVFNKVKSGWCTHRSFRIGYYLVMVGGLNGSSFDGLALKGLETKGGYPGQLVPLEEYLGYTQTEKESYYRKVVAKVLWGMMVTDVDQNILPRRSCDVYRCGGSVESLYRISHTPMGFEKYVIIPNGKVSSSGGYFQHKEIDFRMELWSDLVKSGSGLDNLYPADVYPHDVLVEEEVSRDCCTLIGLLTMGLVDTLTASQVELCDIALNRLGWKLHMIKHDGRTMFRVIKP
jgi:hypothetical protein